VALEKEGTAYCLAVQWHPEELTALPDMRALFRAVVDAASAGRQSYAFLTESQPFFHHLSTGYLHSLWYSELARRHGRVRLCSQWATSRRRPNSWGVLLLDKPEVKVLVIEDHKPFRDILVKVLGLSRYHVIPVELGAAGLEAAQAEHPDIILLDLMMPGMDGYETCRRLRAMPAVAQTPIIVLTALAGEEVEAKVRAAGADVCLTKPCSIVDLERVIREQLQRRHDVGQH